MRFGTGLLALYGPPVPALTVFGLTIAVADALQVILVGKGLGAIGGVILYSAFAWGAWRGHRWALWGALLLPLLPTSILTGLQGPEVAARVVDRGMVGVYAVQLAAAATAAVNLGWGSEDDPDATR